MEEFENWEYWEKKFKGMTEKEIEEYWKQLRREDEEEEKSGFLMDIADGMTPGFRRNITEKQYAGYKKAKEKHDMEVNNNNRDEER